MAADQTERGADGSEPLPAGTESPHLGPGERDQAATRAPLRALVIHEVLREEGEFELRRPPAALLWSGLAAGLSMGFSFLSLALLQAYLPEAPWRHVLASFGYCVGFVIVVLGKQQLFTETTLTAMLPVFYHPRWKSVGILLRMWAIVLVANIAGTIAFAFLLSSHDLFSPQIRQALSAASTASISDGYIVRASMVIIFLFFGYQKWWAYEAQRLIPFIIWWLYPAFGIRGASWFLGAYEWIFGALLFAGFWDKRLCLLGAAGSAAAFIATVTIIPFMPDGWDASASGIPAMTGNVPFLMKDVVLLAASLYLLRQDALRVARQ